MGGCARGVLNVGGWSVEEIGRNGQNHRPRPPTGRRQECLLEHRPGVGRLADLACPLHQRLEHADDIQLLERLAAADVTPDLTNDGDDRGRVRLRGVKTDGQVGGPGAAGRDTERGPAGQLGHRLGHERRGPFVARADDANPVGGQPIEQAENALSGHGEGDLHPGPGKSGGQG